MSLCVSVVTPEGIVMAGESRQTQTLSGVNRIASDTAIKVFQLTDRIIACTTGWAFLQPQGATLPKNVSSIVEDLRPAIPASSTVQAAATLLWNHFNVIYQQHITQIPASALPAGQIALNFVVGGYDPNSPIGRLFSLDIPSTSAPTVECRSTNNPGPWWIGQVDVVARIMNGYDYRALNLPFVQAANAAGAAKTALDGLQYVVLYNTMTVQDAIDFAAAMIRITITVQRFASGTATQLGAIAGVGGPIDIAVVLPATGVRWVSRKELHP